MGGGRGGVVRSLRLRWDRYPPWLKTSRCLREGGEEEGGGGGGGGEEERGWRSLRRIAITILNGEVVFGRNPSDRSATVKETDALDCGRFRRANRRRAATLRKLFETVGWEADPCRMIETDRPFSLQTVRVRPPYPRRVSMLSLASRTAPRFFWTQFLGRRLERAGKATENTCDA